MAAICLLTLYWNNPNMGRSLINSLTRFLLFTLFLLLHNSPPPTTAIAAAISTEFVKGFKATPDPTISTFQALLTDSTHNFSFGFLRINQAQLVLAVLHVPSSEQLWLAKPTRLSRWSKFTHLSFNGSLVLSDPHSGVFWSTYTDGDRVTLLNNSNLQIQTNSTSLWESFSYPGNTLVQNQNFTSAMALVSSSEIYSMRLGDDFIGLYAKFRDDSDQIYLKQTALQARSDIIKGNGPIYARISSDGFLGLYQTNDTVPVDIQAFSSFNRPMNGFLIVRLESDGNLKGYYWDGLKWILDYQAIRADCELPNPCGSYGLCKPGIGCSCLDNRTEYLSRTCAATVYGDFCDGGITNNGFSVMRKEGVELPYKELMEYKTTPSFDKCEGLCEKNCSCWGAVYNNASGFCYLLDYPIQTLVSVDDDTKMGYFKVRKGAAGDKVDIGFKIGLGLLGGLMLLISGIIGYGSYRYWRKNNRGSKMYLEEDDEISPGAYKGLACDSFGSIELTSR